MIGRTKQEKNREKGNMKIETQKFISWLCVPVPKITSLVNPLSNQYKFRRAD